MAIDFAARVEKGPRETNDDRVLVAGHILDMSDAAGELSLPALVAVCDGCGGYAGGGIAAQTVLEFLSFEDPQALADTAYLTQVLENCRRVVFEKKAETPQYAAMCTTLAACLFLDDGTVFFHAGDSRVYRYDTWGLAKMTKDHSAVQELVDMGQLTIEEALSSPRRNIITRCIGIDCPPPDIYVSKVPIQSGEKYLLCSDGLWECVSDAELEDVLKQDISPREMVDILMDKALHAGAEDNISICICAKEGTAARTETTPFVLN